MPRRFIRCQDILSDASSIQSLCKSTILVEVQQGQGFKKRFNPLARNNRATPHYILVFVAHLPYGHEGVFMNLKDTGGVA